MTSFTARALDLAGRIMQADPHRYSHLTRPGWRALLHGVRPAPLETRIVADIPGAPALGIAPGRHNHYKALIYTPVMFPGDALPAAYAVHYRAAPGLLGYLSADADGLFYRTDTDDTPRGPVVDFGRVTFAEALEMTLAFAFLARRHLFADPACHARVRARIAGGAPVSSGVEAVA